MLKPANKNPAKHGLYESYEKRKNSPSRLSRLVQPINESASNTKELNPGAKKVAALLSSKVL